MKMVNINSEYNVYWLEIFKNEITLQLTLILCNFRHEH